MACKYRTIGAWTQECLYGKCAHQELGPYNPTCGDWSASAPMIWMLREATSGEPLVQQFEEPDHPEFPVYVQNQECYWQMERQHH